MGDISRKDYSDIIHSEVVELTKDVLQLTQKIDMQKMNFDNFRSLVDDYKSKLFSKLKTIIYACATMLIGSVFLCILIYVEVTAYYHNLEGKIDLVRSQFINEIVTIKGFTSKFEEVEKVSKDVEMLKLRLQSVEKSVREIELQLKVLSDKLQVQSQK